MKNTFTQEELIMISNSLVLAVWSNNEAAKQTISHKVIEEIKKSNSAICELNKKVCSMMEDDKED